jgi:hypothetical protein
MYKRQQLILVTLVHTIFKNGHRQFFNFSKLFQEVQDKPESQGEITFWKSKLPWNLPSTKIHYMSTLIEPSLQNRENR